jgi:hypothetical protein
VFETVQYVRGVQVIYPTEIGGFTVIPALDTAAMKDELVADFGIASPQVTAAAAFVILILSGFSAPHCGATVYDSDGSAQNIQSIHDTQAHDGDTITVPAGTFSWTTGVTITKGITLQGQTTISGAGTASPVIDNKTIILDNVVPRGQGAFLVKATMSTANQSFRLTGFTFRYGTETGLGAGIGAIRLSSNVINKNMRLDHCNIDQLYHTRGIGVTGGCLGVADHNVISRRTNIGGTEAFSLRCEKWNSDPEGFGNASWADYPWYGTDKFFFIETNTLEYGTATDSSFGARWVYRHNYNKNTPSGDHGSEGSYERGQRCKEIYNNTFNWTSAFGAFVGTRSGSLLVHDNKSTGTPTITTVIANCGTWRESYAKKSPFGTVDGTNVWDANDTEGNGTFVEGDTPHLFDSGTVTSTSAEGILTDSTKSWAVNKWNGYVIKKTGAPFPNASSIFSNTETTLTYDKSGAALNHLIFNAGDSYEIYRTVMAMDLACGGGKSDLLKGSPIKNTTTGTASYGHPTIEPCYSWNNVEGTGTVLGFATLPVVGRVAKLGVHFFNLGNGFTSTPQTVKDKYTAALNGVQYNGDFTYPHPLVSGAPTPTSSATPRSHQHLQKKKKNSKKLKRRNWPKKIGD